MYQLNKMKRLIIILVAGTVMLQTGCKKFSEFQKDPNKPSVATPDLLLNSIEQKALQSADVNIAMACRQLVFTDAVNNNQYYGWTRGSYDEYNNLRQVLKMEQAATAQNKPEYIPLVKFFKAWYFLKLTQRFGDIPYSAALNGDQHQVTPVYGKQEDIYLNILNELNAASTSITNSTAAIQGDIVYNGDMQKWKKAINTLTLRVLLSLSLKENDSRLEVKKRFANIVNNPAQFPVFTGNAENLQLKFNDLQDNRYPYFNNNDIQTTIYMEETFVDLLKGLKDPRLFSFADKAPKFSALAATDFNAYGGVKGSAQVNENNARTIAGEVSKVNPRFYNNPVNEPSIALGYAELQFILAEGAIRGWITGDAPTYFKNGITASMQFYQVDQDQINTYTNTVKLSADAPLQQILTQKYIASFMNGSWQSFYEQRRTGFPVFDVSGAGVLNNKKVPKRWMYPENELTLNQANVSAAISRQYPEGDNINGEMWIIKP